MVSASKAGDIMCLHTPEKETLKKALQIRFLKSSAQGKLASILKHVKGLRSFGGIADQDLRLRQSISQAPPLVAMRIQNLQQVHQVEGGDLDHHAQPLLTAGQTTVPAGQCGEKEQVAVGGSAKQHLHLLLTAGQTTVSAGQCGEEGLGQNSFFVKLWGGRIVVVECRESDTVGVLKKEIERQEAIPEHLFRLRGQGKELAEEARVGQVAKDGEVLEVFLKLMGGMQEPVSKMEVVESEKKAQKRRASLKNEKLEREEKQGRIQAQTRSSNSSRELRRQNGKAYQSRSRTPGPKSKAAGQAADALPNILKRLEPLVLLKSSGAPTSEEEKGWRYEGSDIKHEPLGRHGLASQSLGSASGSSSAMLDSSLFS